MRKKRVLFVGDKWCSGDKKSGISEWETNIWKSLKSTQIAEVETFHPDDFFLRNKQKGDDSLLQQIAHFKPDLILLVLYRFPGTTTNVPTYETLRKIHRKKIPILAIWGDFGFGRQKQIAASLTQYGVIHAVTAFETEVKRLKDPKHYRYIWVPKDESIFYDPEVKRDIPLSYLGSSRPERIKILTYLKGKGVNFFHSGGEREKHLTTKEYASVFQRSQMTISFSGARFCHFINARPFEAMLCGAMLFERENFETAKLFVPFVDYVPFTDKKDLLKKIKYYKKNPLARKLIAQAGKEKIQNLYSTKRLWKELLEQTLKGTFEGSTQFKLEKKNLFLLPFWRSLKLRTANWICSHRTTFFLYKEIPFLCFRFKRKLSTTYGLAKSFLIRIMNSGK